MTPYVSIASYKHFSAVVVLPDQNCVDPMPANDIARIKMEGGFSDATIRFMRSTDEFKVYQDADLMEYEIEGRKLLIPKDLDWSFVDPATGLTNRQLVNEGYNPVDHNGIKYELHHVGQKKNSPLALLTRDQHQKNHSILHPEKVSTIRPNGDNSFWDKDKEEALKCLSHLLNLIL